MSAAVHIEVSEKVKRAYSVRGLWSLIYTNVLDSIQSHTRLPCRPHTHAYAHTRILACLHTNALG